MSLREVFFQKPIIYSFRWRHSRYTNETTLDAHEHQPQSNRFIVHRLEYTQRLQTACCTQNVKWRSAPVTTLHFTADKTCSVCYSLAPCYRGMWRLREISFRSWRFEAKESDPGTGCGRSQNLSGSDEDDTSACPCQESNPSHPRSSSYIQYQMTQAVWPTEPKFPSKGS